MILDGRDFLVLGRLMLISYMDNIERIGGREWAAPYWAYLEGLEEQVQTLNTLHQANVETITKIDVAWLRVDLMTS